MPTPNASLGTLDRKFAGQPITSPQYFAEGHTMTAPEAKWGNSILATVIGNGFGGAIRNALKAKNEADKKAWVAAGNKAKDYVEVTDPTALGWDLQAKFNEMYAEYELGGSNRGSGSASASLNPVDRMVNFLATEELKRRILAKGLKVRAIQTAKAADGETSKFTELLNDLIKRENEKFRAQAEAIVAEQDAGDDDDLLADFVPQEDVADAA